jgi:cell division protein FtsW (lipid II flippase)
LTGVSEILVLILLISGILILPRMFKPATKAVKRPQKALSKTKRAGIVVSVIVPILAAIGLKPWTGNLVLFVSIGIIPVVLAWAMVWILDAKKQ